MTPGDADPRNQSMQNTNFEKAWLVVKSLGNSGYQIAVGDVLKFGRVKFRVKEINTDSAPSNRHSNLADLVLPKPEEAEELNCKSPR